MADIWAEFQGQSYAVKVWHTDSEYNVVIGTAIDGEPVLVLSPVSAARLGAVLISAARHTSHDEHINVHLPISDLVDEVANG